MIARTILCSIRTGWITKLGIPQHSRPMDKQVLWTYRHFSLSSSKLKEFEVKNKDDIIIYEGPLSSRIRLGKAFSLSTSVVGLALQPILYQKTIEAGTGFTVTVFGAVFLGFFTFLTPILLHLVTKKYVTHLVYNSYTEEFTANTYSIFLRQLETKFKAADVTRPEIPTMFASFYVRGKPLFVDPEFFTSIELYKKMLGYDQPIDFKINVPQENKPANMK